MKEIIDKKQSLAEVESAIDRSLAENRVITLITYYLSRYGEHVLNAILSRILIRFGRNDLQEVVYTSVKELIMNATKANLKRVVFNDLGLDPHLPNQYDEGMAFFKKNLIEDRMKEYREKFRTANLPVTVTFYYEPFKVLHVKVKNNFTLLPEEERRIREKFDNARSFDNLMDFYLHFSDNTEGAGMGLSLVGILFAQSGIDRHAFSIYSSERYNETIARLEIPLGPEYRTRRDRFTEEMSRSGASAEELRQKFRRSDAAITH